MPGTRCSVVACNNSLLKTKKDPKLVISYHGFPSDEKLSKIWFAKCRRQGKWNPYGLRVCSVHFKEDDFERDLKAELLNLPKKLTLKRGAIPSLLLTAENVDKKVTKKEAERVLQLNARAERMEKKRSHELVQQILAEHDRRVSEEAKQKAISDNEDILKLDKRLKEIDKPLKTSSISYDLEKLSKNEAEIWARGERIRKKRSQQLMKQIYADHDKAVSDQTKQKTIADNKGIVELEKQLKQANKPLNTDSANLKMLQLSLKVSEQQVQQLNAQVVRLKEKLRSSQFDDNKRKMKAELETEMRSALHDRFTNNQIDLLLKKKIFVKWTDQELAHAYKLRYQHMGKRAYDHLRKVLNYPLPSGSTLSSFAQRTNVKDELTNSVKDIDNDVAGASVVASSNDVNGHNVGEPVEITNDQDMAECLRDIVQVIVVDYNVETLPS